LTTSKKSQTLSIAWGLQFLVPLLLHLFYVDAMGFEMAWGLVIALPLTIIGGLTVIGGVFAPIRRGERD
jgi:hypothetical protein